MWLHSLVSGSRAVRVPQSDGTARGRPIAVILGAHPFPHGNASANRMLTMAQTWNAAGWRCLVINDHPEHQVEGDQAALETTRGVEYVNLGLPGATRRGRARRRRTLGRRAGRAVRQVLGAVQVEYVVVPSIFVNPSTRRSIAREFPRALLVADVVERHDASQFGRGRLEPYFVRHRFTSWYVGRAADRVIVISRALADGPFRRRPTLVLPPCVDTAEVRPLTKPARRDDVQVRYFGSPGSKDDLAVVLRAVAALAPAVRSRLRIELAGLIPAELPALPGLDPAMVESVSQEVRALGRVPREEMLQLLRESDYTILIRDESAGFARYGFPSKVPESMAAGVPPIINLTSDLSDYLTDSNAVVCRDRSTQAVAEALSRAVAAAGTPAHDRQRAAVRQTAEEDLAAVAWGARLHAWLTAQHSEP